MSRYDLLVRGAGATGLAAARGARKAGRSVALVDRAEPGGDCTHCRVFRTPNELRGTPTVDQLHEALEVR
jgi:glycine/D-amino acid oxidase-like deaminating enzyme